MLAFPVSIFSVNAPPSAFVPAGRDRWIRLVERLTRVGDPCVMPLWYFPAASTISRGIAQTQMHLQPMSPPSKTTKRGDRDPENLVAVTARTDERRGAAVEANSPVELLLPQTGLHGIRCFQRSPLHLVLRLRPIPEGDQFESVSPLQAHRSNRRRWLYRPNPCR